METNADRARRGFEAVMRGDLAAINAFLHPDVRWHAGDPDYEGACHNREQVLDFMRGVRTRNPRARLVDVVDAGGQVVLILETPDGRVANLTTFRDGQAIEMVHYDDPDDALRAAGVAG